MPKINVFPARQLLKRFFDYKFFVVVFLLAAVGLGFFVFLNYLKKTQYFCVRQVIVKPAQECDLSYLNGRNIFSLCPDIEVQKILRNFPVYKRVKVVKVFPDRLFIEIVRRKPVALLKLRKYYCIDDDMVIFEATAADAGNKLPLIEGFENRISGAQAGKRYNHKLLAYALQVIKEFRSNPGLKGWPLRLVNAKSAVDFSLWLEPAVEIKFGIGDTARKFKTLSNLLPQIKKEWKQIKYVELRFHEPIIKLKNE